MFEKAPNKKINDFAYEDLSCISLHWQEDILTISNELSGRFAIQGNLNPMVLLETDQLIYEEVKKICIIMKEYPGFIFNLGHGITPDIDPEKVKIMIDAIRE